MTDWVASEAWKAWLASADRPTEPSTAEKASSTGTPAATKAPNARRPHQAAAARACVPTDVPIAIAPTTNATQTATAVFQCAALHRPARAARLSELTCI